MLKDLYIENVAVIEKTQLTLGHGLNVLTGETGAGKSILIGAVGAILGSRTSKDVVRKGCDKALITALFDEIDQETAQKIENLGYECDDGLVLMREIYKDGKNVCKIGGRPANVSLLKEIGQLLLSTHGQHDNQHLLDERNHLDLLDRVGDLQDDLQIYREQFEKVRQLKKKIDSIVLLARDREQQIDMLTYKIKEIETAAPKLGEEQLLEEKISRAKYAQQIAVGLASASLCMVGDDSEQGALDLLRKASDHLRSLDQYLPSMGDLADKITGFTYELQECSATISSLNTDSDGEYVEIDALEQRLDTLYRLKKKYGENIEEVLDFCAECKQKLGDIQCSDEELEQLQNTLKQQLATAKDLALRLRAKRKSAAQNFEKSVCSELAFLNMPGVSFVVNMENDTKLTAKGMDKVLFYISANPGEEPKSISKIASGGELSRMMLAIQNILAEKDQIATLIFDEIDTGVSGNAAHKIGLKLKQVSGAHQVICVTHSAQLAAFGDIHLRIHKEVLDNKTFTTVTSLDEAGQVEELARILSGDVITALSLENAKEIKKMAKNA